MSINIPAFNSIFKIPEIPSTPITLSKRNETRKNAQSPSADLSIPAGIPLASSLQFLYYQEWTRKTMMKMRISDLS